MKRFQSLPARWRGAEFFRIADRAFLAVASIRTVTAVQAHRGLPACSPGADRVSSPSRRSGLATKQCGTYRRISTSSHWPRRVMPGHESENRPSEIFRGTARPSCPSRRSPPRGVQLARLSLAGQTSSRSPTCRTVRAVPLGRDHFIAIRAGRTHGRPSRPSRRRLGLLLVACLLSFRGAALDGKNFAEHDPGRSRAREFGVIHGRGPCTSCASTCPRHTVRALHRAELPSFTTREDGRLIVVQEFPATGEPTSPPSPTRKGRGRGLELAERRCGFAADTVIYRFQR